MDEALPITVDLVGCVVGLILGTIVHEFAHACVGGALGLGARLVAIGRGPVLLRRRIAATWLIVRGLPIGGSVRWLPYGRTRRGAAACSTAAGPAINLLLALLLAPVFLRPLDLDHLYLDTFIYGFGGAQLLIGITALLPFRFKAGGRLHATDGLKLVRFARGRDPDTLAALRATFLRHPHELETPLPPVTPDTPEILYQLSRLDLTTERWARHDSVDVLRRILAAGRLDPREATIVRTRLAIADAHPDLF